MKNYIWKYTASFKKITSSGSIAITFKTAKQQTLKIVLLVAVSGGTQDQGGTSRTSVYTELATTDTYISFLLDEDTTIMLPDNDYISTFNKPKIENMVFMEEDRLFVERGYLAVNATLGIQIRAELNIYARPTIIIGGGAELKSTSHNEIVGVIE